MQRYSLAFPAGRSRSLWFSVQCQLELLLVGAGHQNLKSRTRCWITLTKITFVLYSIANKGWRIDVTLPMSNSPDNSLESSTRLAGFATSELSHFFDVSFAPKLEKSPNHSWFKGWAAKPAQILSELLLVGERINLFSKLMRESYWWKLDYETNFEKLKVLCSRSGTLIRFVSQNWRFRINLTTFPLTGRR